MTPLEQYRAKRDFDRTPEPSGAKTAPADGGLRYVIQKHAASHLHWDLRIELGGVLLSWAVPKGPSLDPSDKRLAMRVEDHPVEYGEFEGVIPKGEYGGGTVMLWDRGTWEPDHGDPAEHLAQGHLKFLLHGQRLRGRWMLVRTKGYGGGRESWLLFKERDEEARPHPFDAEEEWNTSVATGRTMDEIAADVDAVWHSDDEGEATGGVAAKKVAPLDPSELPGSNKAPMPRRIEVELATLVKNAPEGDRWLHEVKFDGYRIIGRINDGVSRLVSRNGKDWTDRFGPIAEALEHLEVESAIFDGEVVVQSSDGTTDFQALQNYVKRGRSAELLYYIFDCLYLDGYDLRGCEIEDRKRALRSAMGTGAPPLAYTDHIEGHGDVFFSRACEYSLEGVVSKRRGSTYRAGRGRDWLKSKCLQRQEFIVVGYTDPAGSRSGFGALCLGANTPEGLRFMGRVGTGFSEQTLADLSKTLRPLVRTTSPVVDPPTGAQARGIHWVEPRLVVEVAFEEFTEDGALRQPSFMGVREDKTADDVVVERAVDLQAAAERAQPTSQAQPLSETAAPEASPQPEESASHATVAGVAVTNPDRVFWPEVPLTKRGLIRYYERVADRMLPHVSARPLSLVRCPQGYTGECFYQKHVENFPPAVGTFPVFEPDAGAEAPYAVIHDVAGLVGLAQMGVLEIHPWGSRVDDIERPDRLVFDLDPHPDLAWSQLVATALLLRSELSRLGLASWVKSTGGKGLHVVVPVVRRLEWGPAKDFTRAFVDSIVSIEPRMFTSNMRKAEREGRIFIDYLRNSRGATAVAPYSTRARSGAPVALPLAWDELEATRARPVFDITNIAERLRLPDPWADIGSVRQSITKRARVRLGLE